MRYKNAEMIGCRDEALRVYLRKVMICGHDVVSSFYSLDVVMVAVK